MMEPYPPPEFVIPGMKVGCLPYHALANSTLECFFSAACLNATARWISSLPPASWPKPLNGSGMSSFLPNTSVGDILGDGMLDHWSEARNFSGYYHICEPLLCTFTTIRKNGVLYLLILLIGLYGGLTVALRMITPQMIVLGRILHHRLKQKCLSRWRNRAGMRLDRCDKADVTDATYGSDIVLATNESSSERANASFGLRVMILRIISLCKSKVLSFNLFEVGVASPPWNISR